MENLAKRIASESLDWPMLAPLDEDHVVRVFAAAERAGYVLAPIEATDEMIYWGHVGDPLGCDVDAEHVSTVYSRIWEFMVRERPKQSGLG